MNDYEYEWLDTADGTAHRYSFGSQIGKPTGRVTLIVKQMDQDIKHPTVISHVILKSLAREDAVDIAAKLLKTPIYSVAEIWLEYQWSLVIAEE